MRLALRALRVLLLALSIAAALFYGGVRYLAWSGVIQPIGRGYSPTNAAKTLLRRWNPFRKTELSRAEALADAAQFFSSLERVHPDVTANVGMDGYEELKRGVAARIESGTELGRKLPARDLAYELYLAAAALRDGHTSLAYEYRPDTASGRKCFPPFILSFDNGRYLIASAGDGSVKGREISAVNGVPVRQFLRPITDRLSGETYHFKANRFIASQSFWWDFSGLLDTRDGAFEVEFTAPEESARTRRRFNAVTAADFLKLDYPSTRSGLIFSIFDKQRIGWLTYSSFELSDERKAQIDAGFRRLKTERIKDLVIDLRGNGGGNSGMGDFILSYLIKGKFRQFSKTLTRLSPEYFSQRPQAKRGAGSSSGTLVSEAPERDFGTPEAFFEGRTYLLTDNKTFSSASAFAATFRDYKVGEILGYETGGLCVSFGDIISLELQNSGIPYRVSSRRFFCSKPRPGDDRRGIQPGLPFNDTLLRPYRGEVQRFVLNYVTRRRNSKPS